jgi:alpha-tubulin suppressor-like RCC1 family protein/subtilisin family serine protease
VIASVATVLLVAGLLPLGDPAVRSAAAAADGSPSPILSDPALDADRSVSLPGVDPRGVRLEPNVQPLDPESARDLLATAGADRQPSSVQRTDQVVVTWSTDLDSGAARQRTRLQRLTAASGRGVRYKRLLAPGRAVYNLGEPLGAEAPRILERLMGVPGVVRVEPDLWVTPDVLPNDTHAAELWGLLGAADGSPYGIDAVGAWATTQGAGITVAVIDTGIVDHPDLAGRIVPGWDMVTDLTAANDGDGRDGDASDPGDWGCGRDSIWHGTHVAGTIVATANNSIGVFGGAPLAKVQSVRALGSCGGYASDIGDAIRWASGSGGVAGAGSNATPSRVLNLSLGGDGACPSFVEAAIDEARAAGSVVVVAAGNSNADAGSFFPADCPGVVTVAAIAEDGRRASFSNFGPDVDVAGPGVGVKSTIDTGTTVPAGPTYGDYNGTSMATPHVAATAALVADAYPALDPAAIEATIRITAGALATDATPSGCAALGCGSGVADAATAVTALDGTAPLVGVLSVTPRYASSGFLDVVATAVDLDGIAAAEVNIGGATYSAMTAADGAFGADSEIVTKRLSLPAADGDHLVCARARDSALHVSTPVCTPVTVDRLAPVVTNASVAPVTVPAGVPASATATASDGSGVVAGELRVDGGAWEPIALAQPGATSTTMRSRVDDPAISITAGLYHACALATGGTVQCWGYNGVGALGDGSTTDRTIPTAVQGLTGAVAVSAGGYHTCVVMTDTTVRCWGENGSGQLGDGTTTGRLTATPVAGLSGVTAVAAGAFHTCALIDDGTARCWGYNAYGALGDGSTADSPTPVTVSTLAGATSLVAGGYHTCALRSGGAAPMCWGYNFHAQLGDGTQTDRSIPVAVGGLASATQLSAGILHTCARLSAGTARCWGSNFDGAIGELGPPDTCPNLPCAATPTDVPGLTGVTQVIAGGHFSCALRSNGTMRCWGDNLLGSVGDGTDELRPNPVPVVELTGAIAATGGRYHTCARLTDGRVRCWGLGLNGQLGNGDPGIWTAPTNVLGMDGPMVAGSHNLCLRAQDLAGNRSAGASCATLTVTDGTAPIVRIIAAQVDSPVGGTSLEYHLGFNEPVTGLAAADLTISGTSTGWSVGSITGSGASYTVRLSGPSATSGTLVLSLNAGSVVGGLAGPSSPAAAPSITIDRAAPSVTTPVVAPSPVGAAPSAISTTANDAGGVSGVALRLDGGAWVPMGATDGAFDENSEAASLPVNDPIVEIAAGDRHTCAALGSGAVRCWGANGEGQLGNGTLTDRILPTPVPGISTAIGVAVGYAHSCALLADGTIRCWGTPVNAGSALGDGTAVQRRLPVQVSGITTAVAITAGYIHTCAVLADGTARCWGDNGNRQLGDGSTTGSTAPVVVAGVNAITQITAGLSHTCALRTDNTIRCWGSNSLGTLGDGTTTDRTGPVTVVAGAGSSAALSGVVQVDAGIFSTCAVLAGGGARCWGFQNSGVLGNGSRDVQASAPVVVTGISTATDVSVGGTGQGGYAHACARLADGTTRCWGFDNNGQLGDGGFTNRLVPNPVGGLTAVAAVTAGSLHTCALVAGGRASCWGANLEGRLGDGTATARSVATTVSAVSGATTIATGGVRIHVDLGGPGHACARLSGGTVRCWGANNVGQLGDGTMTDRPTPVPVSGLAGATALTAGHGHTCAVLSSGGIRCWGGNSAGQLGDGGTTNRSSPVAVVGISTATSVATGSGLWWVGGMLASDPSSTCALLSGGGVRCWGDNGYGQLGDGTLQTRLTPVVVSGISTATAIAKSHTHSCAVLKDTTVRCWGHNAWGQLGDGTLTDRSTPVAVRAGPGSPVSLTGAVAVVAGSGHTCARMTDGTVRCWGLNISGQLGDASFADRRTPVSPLGLGHVKDLTAGQRHTCAITLDGTARCWGEPDFGKLGAPPSIWSTGVPQFVFSVHGATDIAGGAVDTCALVADGTARCWGDNLYGQVGDGTTSDRSTPRPVLGLTGALSAGSHTVCVRATDRAGNTSAGASCTTFSVVDETPPSVQTFVATTPSPTGALTVTYALTFSEPVTGLISSDFAVTGTSTPWTVGVTGSGTSYSVTLSATNPTDGSLILTLKAAAVTDAADNDGPTTARAAPTVTIVPFNDIADSPFFVDILWLAHEGITTGCAPRLYCPDASVTRAEMASFLARALDLSGPAPNAFTDDNGSIHEPNINLVAREGIATGCGVNLFCPDGLVSREQMASFLARALDLSGPAPNAFTDDNGSIHEVNINLVAREGIATGCGGTNYCPTADVTRGQMAAFLHRADAFVAEPSP